MLEGPLVFVDIDTQRDFLELTGALYVPGSAEIVPKPSAIDPVRPAPSRADCRHGLRPPGRRSRAQALSAPLHGRHGGHRADRRDRSAGLARAFGRTNDFQTNYHRT